MASISYRRIRMEDLSGAPAWVPVMLNPLNLFLEQVNTAVNGQLTLGTNTNGMVYSGSFTCPANYAGGGFNSFSFQYTGAVQPTSCIIGRISNSNGSIITQPTSVQWTYNSNVSPAAVVINYVAGLTAGSTYNITLALF